MTPDFLTTEDVLLIHAMQLDRFGGGEGLRDVGLLESALAQPMSGFGEVFAHADLFEMAAAYIFHLASNHPFIDGNKRIGLAAALVFLDLNGHPIRTGTERLYALTMAVARSEIDKAALADAFRELASSPTPASLSLGDPSPL